MYPLRLADRLWLAAHRDSADGTLRCRTDHAVLALACAGGLLVELVVDELVACQDTVTSWRRSITPERVACATLLHDLPQGGSAPTTREWLSTCWPRAEMLVRSRLLLHGMLTEHIDAPSRWRSGHRITYTTSLSVLHTPARELATSLAMSQVIFGDGGLGAPAHVAEVTWGCLAAVTGLLRHLDTDQPLRSDAQTIIAGWRHRLPPGPARVVGEVEYLLADSATRP